MILNLIFILFSLKKNFKIKISNNRKKIVNLVDSKQAQIKKCQIHF